MKPLIKSLKDDSSTVRLSAITALGQLGQPQAVDPITRLLKDRNSRVRYTAQKTLKNQFHLEKRPLTQKRKNKRFTQPNIKETEIYYTKIQSNTQGKNLFCPSCSYPIRKEDNFCQQCGTNIKKCPKCSYPLQTDAKFCTKCGSTLKLELSMKDLERLQKLHDLKNKCILTEEEFKAKKRDILNFND